MTSATLNAAISLSKETLEIRQVPVLSTAHCPSEAIAQGSLFKDRPMDSWRLYHQSPFGAGYYFGDDTEIIEQELGPIVGPEMTQLFLALAALGFVEVRFDSDGQTIEGLPVFDWAKM